MVENKSDYLEGKIKKLKAENKSLRETASLLKGEILKIKRALRDRDRLINSMPAGIILTRDGKILEINSIMLEQLGYRADEVIGRDFLDIVHRDEEEYVRRLQNIWNSGKMAQGEYDVHLVARGGRSIYCDINVKRIRHKSRTAFLMNLTRLEKRKELEQEKIRSRKREAFITMALGVNGEFRSYNEFILRKMKELKEIARSGDIVFVDLYKMLKDVSDKTRRISREMELIGGKEEEQERVTHFDMNKMINEAVESTIGTWKAGPESRGIKIDLKTYLRSSSLVEGDTQEIKDVIIHLITNAVEAMPDGGEIYITTEDNADYAHIYIQDSGIGVPGRLLERVFDPFFSTKGETAAGLGLSLTYAIVKRYKGDIEMSSREGEGTIFHIRLPLVVQGYKVSKVEKKKIRDAQILIIQEEDVVRDLLSHVLISKGCKVETANNGLEGMGKLRKKDFDLLIADAEILHEEGGLLIKKYGKKRPQMSIALIRGAKEANNYPAKDELVPDLNIMKPVDVNMVLKQVSEVLMNRR